jgi:uncharacterized delta-60 repeat protein
MDSIESLEPRRLFAAGDLDPTFGNGGIAQTPPPEAVTLGAAIVLDDDRILVGGYARAGTGLFPYLIRRFNPDGTPDTTFGGGDGLITGQFNTDEEPDDRVQQLRVTADNKILALSNDTSSSPTHVDLARFNADGSLDTTFASAGVLAFDSPANDAQFAIQPNGKILLGHENAITRYTADGKLDTTFGTGGTVTKPLGATFGFSGLTTLADGSVLFPGQLPEHAGNGDGRFTVFKLTPDGAVDVSFGDQGKSVTELPPDTHGGGHSQHIMDLDPLPNGDIIATGAVGYSAGVIRLHGNGARDMGFNAGTGYQVVFQDESPARAVVDKSGRIYVSGPAGSVGRLRSDGTADPTFGVVSGGGAFFLGYAAGIQSNGRLIIPGAKDYSTTPHIQLTARLTEDDGNPSPFFISNRTLFANGTAGDDRFFAEDITHALMIQNHGFGRIFNDSDFDRISLSAGAGNDYIQMDLHGVTAHVSGGTGSDHISGGERNDTLEGNAGRDFINGGGGADVISGGAGNDQIGGGAGADHIYGRAGNDVIEGNGGADRIDGGDGTDILHGNGQNDVFISLDTSFIDQVFGDGGHDSAHGDGDDLLTSIEALV